MLTTDQPVPPTDQGDRPTAGGRAWWPALLLALVLGGAALVRLRRLMEVPSLTDETDEVLRALAIAQGRLWPLVNDDAYIGALFNYLVAGALLLTGPNPVAPRGLVLGAALLTLLLTYWLGREIGGRWTGLLATALLATAGLHIVVNSRVAWSHSITPLFTTATLLALLVALRRASGPLLVLTGLLAGLALQTHPSVAALLPALALGYLADRQGRAWLRTPWPYLALAAAVLGCANLLWFNLISQPGQALREAESYDYAYERKTTLDSYGAMLLSYAIELIRSLGSVYGTRRQLDDYLSNPAFVISGGLLLVGLLRALRHRRWLLPLVFVWASLALPFFGRQFGFLPSDLARYLAYLLPPGFVLIGWAVLGLSGTLIAWLGRLVPPAGRGLVRRGGQGLTIIAGLALIWFPLSGTLYFEDTFARRNETQLMTRTIDVAVAARNGAIYVDERFNRDLLFGGGHLQHSLIYLLELRGIEHRTLTVPAERAETVLAPLLTPGTVAIIHQSNLSRLAPLPLEELFVVTSEMRNGRVGYGAYRVGRR